MKNVGYLDVIAEVHAGGVVAEAVYTYVYSHPIVVNTACIHNTMVM